MSRPRRAAAPVNLAEDSSEENEDSDSSGTPAPEARTSRQQKRRRQKEPNQAAAKRQCHDSEPRFCSNCLATESGCNSKDGGGSLRVAWYGTFPCTMYSAQWPALPDHVCSRCSARFFARQTGTRIAWMAWAAGAIPVTNMPSGTGGSDLWMIKPQGAAGQEQCQEQQLAVATACQMFCPSRLPHGRNSSRQIRKGCLRMQYALHA